MKKVFLGHIEENLPNQGYITWLEPDLLTEKITNSIGKRVKLVIEDKKRTLPQNSLYWAYLHIISRETGNDIQDLHYSFRFSFLEPQLVEVSDFNKGGRTMVAELRSTTSLSKQEFTDYLERICAETGIPIPNAEEISSYFEE